MTHSKLKQSLSQLQAEIKTLRSIPHAEKKHLETIVRNIEQMLDTDEEPDNKDISKTLKDSMARFEASHPRLTAILNDIMVTLSNMGI